MSLVLNLGMSAAFVRVDWESIAFPATFLIDYVRVYQDEDAIDIGCDRECLWCGDCVPELTLCLLSSSSPYFCIHQATPGGLVSLSRFRFSFG